MRSFYVLSLVLLGCGADPDPVAPPVSQFALSQLGQGSLDARGITRHPQSGNLWILAQNVGLVEATLDGQYVSTLPFSTSFPDYGFSDVALRADGNFVLPGAGEGFRYDPAVGVASYFCLEPGWIEEIVLDNQAVAIDPEGERIVVAPVYYNISIDPERLAPIQASIATYAVADGQFLSAVDVRETGIIAKGIAAEDDKTWVVEGNHVHRFTGAGAVEASAVLDGVEDAAGLTFAGTRLVVLDAPDLEGGEVRMFERQALP